MLNIVIPMAGAGSRFAQKGYDRPKPFIVFNGKMMIEHVLESLAIEGARFTLIVRDEHLADDASSFARIHKSFAPQIVTVSALTQGAVCTALAAHRLFDNEDPVLFADSDNIFSPALIGAFVKDMQDRKLDGSLLTTPSTNPGFSYVQTDAAGHATEVREKDPFSPHAITGAYLFAKGRAFMDCALDMLLYGHVQKGEYYMSGAYQEAIRRGLTIGFYEIANDTYDCVGTPAQLEAYLAEHSA